MKYQTIPTTVTIIRNINVLVDGPYIESKRDIAQMAVVPFWQADFEEVSELDETERGAGGFGSTGKQ